MHMEADQELQAVVEAEAIFRRLSVQAMISCTHLICIVMDNQIYQSRHIIGQEIATRIFVDQQINRRILAHLLESLISTKNSLRRKVLLKNRPLRSPK